MKRFTLSLALLLVCAAVAHAQQQTGDIFGKVTDQSGGALPGVTVTITAPNLLQPLIAVTSETGSYQFPRLEIGTRGRYSACEVARAPRARLLLSSRARAPRCDGVCQRMELERRSP